MVGYSPAEVFRTLDDVDMRAYAGLVLASGGYYVQYIANVRKGFRDRIHATPVPANMWNFADDIIYLALVGRWFGIRFSLGDLFPRLARREALVLYVGLQASLITLMAFFIQLVDDRILVLAITTTQVSSISSPRPRSCPCSSRPSRPPSTHPPPTRWPPPAWRWPSPTTCCSHDSQLSPTTSRPTLRIAAHRTAAHFVKRLGIREIRRVVQDFVDRIAAA